MILQKQQHKTALTNPSEPAPINAPQAYDLIGSRYFCSEFLVHEI